MGLFLFPHIRTYVRPFARADPHLRSRCYKKESRPGEGMSFPYIYCSIQYIPSMRRLDGPQDPGRRPLGSRSPGRSNICSPIRRTFVLILSNIHSNFYRTYVWLPIEHLFAGAHASNFFFCQIFRRVKELRLSNFI